MRRKTCATLAVLVVLASVPAVHAALIFNPTKYAPAGATTDVQVVQTPDADNVRVTIQLACNFDCQGIAGGFQAVGPAMFGQNPSDTPFLTSIAPDDTAFYGSPSLIIGPTADNATLLHTQGATYLGQTWPGTGTGTFFDFAQLVLPTNSVAETVDENGVPGPIVFTNDLGQFVATLSGTIETVPEPASLLLMGMGLFGLGLVAYRRRGSKD